MIITAIKREFTFEVNNETITMQDPNESLTPEEVCSLFSNTYPELTNANVENKGIVEDKNVFEFNTVLGTKG